MIRVRKLDIIFCVYQHRLSAQTSDVTTISLHVVRVLSWFQIYASLNSIMLYSI